MAAIRIKIKEPTSKSLGYLSLKESPFKEYTHMFSLRSIFDSKPVQPVASKASILMKGSTEQIFRYLGDNFFENYPKWSPEVKELKQIGDQPMGPGVTARQVRVDGGHRSESKFRITLYEPNRSLAFAGISEPFHCMYEIQDEGREGLVKLIFTFELLEMKIFMRPFERLIRIAVQHGAERTVRNIKNLIEADADIAINTYDTESYTTTQTSDERIAG